MHRRCDFCLPAAHIQSDLSSNAAVGGGTYNVNTQPRQAESWHETKRGTRIPNPSSQNVDFEAASSVQDQLRKSVSKAEPWRRPSPPRQRDRNKRKP